MLNEFELAINQICEEKGIPKEKVKEAMEAAIAAAFKKDYGEKGQLIEVDFDFKTGKSIIYKVQEVVEKGEEVELEKPKQQIFLEEAKKIKKDVKIGDLIKTDVTPMEISFGRIAAQTAKQVITQKIREAEKEETYKNFKGKEGELINGVIQRIERQVIFVDLGFISGILPFSEQIRSERYRIGQRLKVFIKEVNKISKGPEIILSRSEPGVVKELFRLEVPEISAGTVEIRAIAREAGFRSKVAVFTKNEDIDPIGACVGQRGTRVQTVIAELGGEKIDIISWDENTVRFITNALSPAKIMSVKIDEKEQHALVEVAEDQLSLAIGKEGQNVRLAVKLTGWKIDIMKESTGEKVAGAEGKEKGDNKKEDVAEDKKEIKDDKKQELQKAQNKIEPISSIEKEKDKTKPKKKNSKKSDKKEKKK